MLFRYMFPHPRLLYHRFTSSALRVAAFRPFHGGRAENVNDQELVAARQWLAQFNPETIPRNIGEVSFSRSSGPGGQNVNKVNSKATLRVPLPALYQLVPAILHTEIRASRYRAAKADALIIQADDSRKQNENVHSCFKRLNSLIIEAGRKTVPGATSQLQKSRVQGLQTKDNDSRLKAKKFHSSKKSSRRGDL